MIGQIIGGHYKITKKLGEGGFGTVYLAQDQRLERPVAIKVLHKASEEAQKGFEREAKVIARLNHPNIGLLYHVADVTDDQMCIIMAFYEGWDLRKKLAKGPLDVAQTLSYITQTAKGLNYAHKHGVIHRDIKPANVLITGENDDEVKILDFGVARVLTQDFTQNQKGFAGSVVYAPPESLQSSPPNPQTDIWSWGVMFFEMLAGNLPFGEANKIDSITYAILRKPLDELKKYITLADNHQAIQNILDKALAKPLHQRYKEFTEVLDDLSYLGRQNSTEKLLIVTTEIYNQHPYKGLAAFKEQDNKYFCGRDAISAEIVEKLATKNFLALIGASGSGKSSLVFAGVLPKIRKQGNWIICSFRPQNNPFMGLANVFIPLLYQDKLEQAKKREEFSKGLQAGDFSLATIAKMIVEEYKGKNLLLIIDQFEELYTLNNDLAQNNFITQVLDALQVTNMLTILLTMRADFISHTTKHPQLTEALNKEGIALLGAMSHDNLQAAIEKPAEECGVFFSAGLVEDILDDVLRDSNEEVAAAGRLPLLEFALTRLWEKKENPITHSTYRAIGKVAGALVQHAEQVYQTFSNKEQESVEQIFVQLVQPGEGTADTRQVVSKKQLGEKNWQIVSRLADQRLVTTGTTTGTTTSNHPEEVVEIIHETLIRSWQRLKKWVDNNREFRLWQNHLRQTIEIWKSSSDDSMLLQGGQLLQAQKYLKSHKGQMEDAEKFIKLSAAKHKENERKRLRQQKKLSFAVAITVILLVASAGLSIWFGINTRRAKQEALQAQQLSKEKTVEIQNQNALSQNALIELDLQRAQKTELETRDQANNTLARQLAEKGLAVLKDPNYFTHGGFDTAALLAVQAVQIVDNKESVSNMLFTLQQQKNLIATWHGHTDEVTQAIFSPDNTKVASSSKDNTIRLWNTVTGKPIGKPWQGHNDAVFTLDFTPDGSKVVSGSRDNTIRLWDIKTGKSIGRPWRGHSDVVRSLDFSPDGTKVVSGSWDNTIRLWDPETGKSIGGPWQKHTEPVRSVVFSPDGTKVASGSDDRALLLWDVKTGQLITAFWQVRYNGIGKVIFSPDGTSIVFSQWNGRNLWYTSINKSVNESEPWHEHSYDAYSFDFSPDGKQIIFGGRYSNIDLWDVETNQRIGEVWKGHSYDVNSVNFSSDGTKVVSGSRDGTVRLWNTYAGKPLERTLPKDQNDVNTLALSPDDTKVISGNSGGAIHLWDIETSKVIGEPWLGHEDSVNSIVFSSDGTKVVSGSSDKTIRLWNLGTGQAIGEPWLGHNAAVLSVAISPDGKKLVSGGEDNTIYLWNAETGEVIGEPWLGHSATVLSVAFSPDGTKVISGSSDATMRLWNVNTGEIIGEPWLGHNEDVNSVNFSTDGTKVISGSNDETLRLWNAESGELIGDPWLEHNYDVTSVDFSPDSTKVVSGSLDNTVRLWDVETGTLIGNAWLGHEAGVNSVAFFATGTRIISGSNSSLDNRSSPNILMWNADQKSWQEQLCRIAGRNFTQAEWTKYLGKIPYEKTCPQFPKGF